VEVVNLPVVEPYYARERIEQCFDVVCDVIAAVWPKEFDPYRQRAFAWFASILAPSFVAEPSPDGRRQASLTLAILVRKFVMGWRGWMLLRPAG
jgi:hypothetical protein